jgi:hypothetical protein
VKRRKYSRRWFQLPKGRTIRVARHEAAHAVVATMLGFQVERVFLTNRGTGGCVTRDPRRPCPLMLGMIAMSGHAADRKWSGVPLMLVPAGDHRIVKRLGFSGRSLPTLVALARGQVEVHAELILRVARELKKRDLTGREVRAIIRGCR